MSGSNSFDDEFAEEARRAEAEEKAKQESHKKGEGYIYEDIKWTGFSDNTPTKVLRFIGKHPDLHVGSTLPASSPVDAHVVNMSQVIGDNGRRMDMYLPIKERNPNHIIWRIIDRVNAIEWRKRPDKVDPKKINNEKVYTNELKYPDIYNIINYSGLPADNLQRKYGLVGRGWSGREILIANVIDREMAEWHATNKHTVLLAKKITVKTRADGTINEFIDKGVPSYGLNNQFNSLRKIYGDWEKYDIGFTRTGSKDNPNDIYNAGRTPEKLPSNLQKLVSFEYLTEAEQKYVGYDISKIFGVSSYTKLWNRLHLTIERIDACLGTNYAEELKNLADDEAATRGKNASVQDDVESEDSVTEEEDIFGGITETAKNLFQPEAQEQPVNASVSAPRVISRKVPTDAAMTMESMDGWKGLTDSERAGIVSATKMEGKEWKVVFNDTKQSMAACPECSTVSPVTYSSCCGCGVKFS